MSSGIANLPLPVFVNDADELDPNLILADMLAAYQTQTGRTLQPAQVERLIINLIAYRESLVRNQIQYTGQQNLLAFATGVMLDYIAQRFAITRLAAQAATVTIQFTLNGALTVPYTIPAGTMVGSQDGNTAWSTTIPLVIPAGNTTGSVSAQCTVGGAPGNGYVPGQISVLLTPNALIASVQNTDESGGTGETPGESPETDDHLRERIQLAPNQSAVAGPVNAYRFFALGVDPSIIDAQVVSPNPGAVAVYLLTGPITQPAASPNNAGIAGSPLLSKALSVLSADDVRPLTDTVSALAVTEIDYVITATVTLFADADPTTVQAAVQQAAQLFAVNLASRIQRNIVKSQIASALSVEGVYEVALSAPSADVALTAGQWANCTAITLTFNTSSESS